MQKIDTERIEVDLLLEAMYQRYGWDFRSYARASVERRAEHARISLRYESISSMIPKLLHDELFFQDLLRFFSIPVTEMFRDPFVYQSVRENVLPVLRTWPHFKIWHAGCATGEEAYSMSIILHEEGLKDRATIYATDFSDFALEKAREGIYGIEKQKEATVNYKLAGGKRSFSEYYHASYDAITLRSDLKNRIAFANHNLALDRSFGEMHLIFCRNVLIYFGWELQNRVLKLFSESLARGGFLCLGTKEDLSFTEVADEFEQIDEKARIYKKRLV
ncbi:MAG: protein-glutamate O-methyltransferase CheR [Planctomycetes bacterium]|nr:protein-glutamate O-methyltransferase CheR [Planctomycetota bacterium]